MAKGKCFVCSSREDLETHHIDFNHNNNDPDNLMTLCERCHTEITKYGYTPREELAEIREKVLKILAGDSERQASFWPE